MTKFVIAEIKGAQSNSFCVNLTSVLHETLANIRLKTMPLYGVQSLTDVCVYTSETECKIISLPVPSPPEDIVWTENSPGNQSHFFLWNFSTVTAKNEPIKRDLNGFLCSLL